MASALARRELLDLLHRGFIDQGWDDHDDAAGSIVTAISRSDTKTLAGIDIDAAVPTDFLERNGVDIDRVTRFLEATVGDTELSADDGRRRIVFPEDIDTFAQVASVSVADVAGVPQPLALSEADVKRLLLDIVGEQETDNDWGGELSDAFTTNVTIRGKRIATAFVLKGPSEKGVLTPRRYGKNGDQITRAFKQRASLFVIQANARLDSSVHDLVDGLVSKARSEGDERAVATLWDGTDTARILVAYGKIDRQTGVVL